jgi:hypothetical protein
MGVILVRRIRLTAHPFSSSSPSRGREIGLGNRTKKTEANRTLCSAFSPTLDSQLLLRFAQESKIGDFARRHFSRDLGASPRLVDDES